MRQPLPRRVRNMPNDNPFARAQDYLPAALNGAACRAKTNAGQHQHKDQDKTQNPLHLRVQPVSPRNHSVTAGVVSAISQAMTGKS